MEEYGEKIYSCSPVGMYATAVHRHHRVKAVPSKQTVKNKNNDMDY